VLLIEDNPHDARLTAQALQEAKVHNRVQVVADGQEALDYLHRRGPHAEARMPDLILLDLNLPKSDGQAVLEEIKRDERLQHIPVVSLTGSKAEGDVARSYRLHANAYVTKPFDAVAFLQAVTAVERFWLEIVKLPAGERT
jgi:two-component system response regulator